MLNVQITCLLIKFVWLSFDVFVFVFFVIVFVFVFFVIVFVFVPSISNLAPLDERHRTSHCYASDVQASSVLHLVFIIITSLSSKFNSLSKMEILNFFSTATLSIKMRISPAVISPPNKNKIKPFS